MDNPVEGARRRENDDAILKELRRRDNLEDFVDGLIRTEVFPYPDGQLDMVIAYDKMVPLQQIKLKPGAYEDLTIIYGHDFEITLTPEYGVGTYEIVEYMSPVNLKETEKLRMALWGRYEWVMEKVEYINCLRAEAYHGTGRIDDFLIPHHDVTAVDDCLSEEVDPFDSDDVTSLGSEFSQISTPLYEPDGKSTDETDFPDAGMLKDLDIQTLKAMFEKKELQSLHEAMKAASDNTEAPTETTTSKKRRLTITAADFTSKRSRKEGVEGIMSNFCTVAQKLPTTEADDAEIRAFREAAGNLHLAARVLELEVNLRVVKEESMTGGDTDGAKTGDGAGTSDDVDILPDSVTSVARVVFQCLMTLTTPQFLDGLDEQEIATRTGLGLADVRRSVDELDSLYKITPTTNDHTWAIL